MRRSKPLALVAGAALLTLAACGGSGGNDPGAKNTRTYAGEEGGDKNPKAAAPAADVEGAKTGGTITVYLPGDPGPADLDPTGGWSVTGNSIQQALTSRSLTQYFRNSDGSITLVPDLATDLGTHNADYTEWKFTIRDGVKWEDGSPVTAEEVAWGLCRSMDSDTFPSGPGTEYSQTYFYGAGKYKGPYTEKDPSCTKWGGTSVDGNTITIKMSKPFPDMDYWGAFMAMGAVPTGKASTPPDYGQNIMSDGPYKVESFRAEEELTLVKNDQWDPNTDPARHQYADKFVFKFNQDQAKVDQIMLSDNTESQTALSASLGSNNYDKANTQLGDRLVQQSSQCTSFLAPDYGKTTLNVRKAIAYAYPYEDAWLAGGEVPGVTRVPANSIMPPGMAGKKDYFVDGEQFTYNPDKAKELLSEEGYGDSKPYPITMVYYEADPLAVAAQKVYVKGMAEAGFAVKGIPVQESPYNIWLNPDDKTNKTLNLRGVNWCSDWPSGLTMLPPLVRTGAAYNTAQFSEKAVDDRINEIPSLPLNEQAAAWGDLDQEIETKYFPIIPTAFRNDLFVFGSKIGNPAGDGQMGAPDYKDLYVAQ